MNTYPLRRNYDTSAIPCDQSDEYNHRELKSLTPGGFDIPDQAATQIDRLNSFEKARFLAVVLLIPYPGTDQECRLITRL